MGFPLLEGDSSWTAAYGNMKQYMVVDFGRRLRLTAIATQGHAFTDAFVTAFFVSASDDGHFWFSVYTDHNTNQEAISLRFFFSFF